jgi:hypothetical protein
VGSALDTKRDWNGLMHATFGCASFNIKLLLKQGEMGFLIFKQTVGSPRVVHSYRWW